MAHVDMNEYICKFAQGGMAIDAGANEGLMTKLLAKHAEKVLAFEPYDRNAQMIRDLRLMNVEVHEVALNNFNGECNFYIKEWATSSISEEVCGTPEARDKWGKPTETRLVKCRTLDSYKLPNVKAIKIDVEGADVEVLEGMLETLRNNQTAICIETHGNTNCKRIYEMFCLQCDYKMWDPEYKEVNGPDMVKRDRPYWASNRSDFTIP